MNIKKLIQKVLNKIYSLLTRQRVVVYSRALLLAIIIFFSLGILSSHIDTKDFNKGDFRAFYTAGVIVSETNSLEGMELYDTVYFRVIGVYFSKKLLRVTADSYTLVVVKSRLFGDVKIVNPLYNIFNSRNIHLSAVYYFCQNGF